MTRVPDPWRLSRREEKHEAARQGVAIRQAVHTPFYVAAEPIPIPILSAFAAQALCCLVLVVVVRRRTTESRPRLHEPTQSLTPSFAPVVAAHWHAAKLYRIPCCTGYHATSQVIGCIVMAKAVLVPAPELPPVPSPTASADSAPAQVKLRRPWQLRRRKLPADAETSGDFRPGGRALVQSHDAAGSSGRDEVRRRRARAEQNGRVHPRAKPAA
jgi:hypothetical protein